MNTLALRGDLSGDPTFLELLSRVRDEVLAAFAHDDLPFEKLVETLQPDRSLNQAPLFQVMFDFQRVSVTPVRLDGLVTRPVPVENATAKFDLTFAVVEDESGLSCGCEYRVDLFDESTASGMLRSYEALLRGLVAAPGRRVSGLPLLGAAEARALVAAGVGPVQTVALEQPVAEGFAAQAARTPTAVAVTQGGQAWSYGELEARANQLARLLHQRGAGPEVLVGVCLERSFDLVVALLGILKAGAAYVPLDPAYPSARLEFMLTDCRTPLLVTEERLAARFAGSTARVVCVDRDATLIGQQSAAPVASAARPEHLAYVIYTSGSTGQPKGVMIEQRALVNYCAVAARTYDLGAGDRMLQFASLSFDASAEEIFAPLLHGATVVLRTATMVDSAAGFLRDCGAWGVTVLSVPTVYWHELAAGLGEIAWPATVRLVICGGERALPGPLAEWQRRVPRVRLLNSYGPTETTVAATVSDVSAGTATAGREVPIGRALANYATLILDAHGQPVPAGVTGELHVGGVSLARGYLNRPELTAEKFGAHPYSATPGARLYRTGDRARQRADGTIECVGRTDEQVKIRGVRLELGEVETVLSGHPAVAATAVVARREANGETRLIGYVVAHGGASVTAEALRNYLHTRLAEPMIPAWFVMLPALPRTPNGKIDRLNLPGPTTEQRTSGTEFVAPRGPVEEVLAHIWEEVLGVERVGSLDNFFALGGHSLLATRVVAHVRDTLQFELPLRRVFEAPTVAGLANVVTSDPVVATRLTARAAMVLKLSALSDEEVERMFAKPSVDGQT